MEFLQRMVAENALMVVVSDDFRICARLSLQALTVLAQGSNEGAQAIVQRELAKGLTDEDAAQCLALVTAFEERVEEKLQSMYELAQTAFVSIGKHLDVPLPQALMHELGRSMADNLALIEAAPEHALPSGSLAPSESGTRASLKASSRSRAPSAAGEYSGATTVTASVQVSRRL